MPDKIYVGNGKKKVFENGGYITSVTLDLDDLQNYFNEYGFTTDQGKRKIKIKVCARKEVDQYGNTHFVELDTWKPNQQQTQPPRSPRQNTQGPVFNSDDTGFDHEIPF